MTRLVAVGAGSSERLGAETCAESDRFGHGESGAEPVGQAGSEAVACPVAVRRRAGNGHRVPGLRLAAVEHVRPALVPRRGHLEARPRVQVSGAVSLTFVAPASDESVEEDVRFFEGRERARRRHEHPGLARGFDGTGVSTHEVDGVRVSELIPRQIVVPARPETFADHRDGALAGFVDVREPVPLRLGPHRGAHLDPSCGELRSDAPAEVVVADRGEERAFPGETGELHRRHSPTSGGLAPSRLCVDDLSSSRNVLDAHELDPLHVTHDRDPHGGSLTSRRPAALEQMMNAVAIPPFERFYEEYRDEIYAYLRRLAGREAADDAFQETFLRALRGYPRLAHGRHLRAWAYTIATRVAIDERRRRAPAAELPELPADDDRPAYAELDHLTGDLPATERAAVVLRYGYDLDYADIATALGSSEDAARQAASSGVRRLRRRMT